NSESSGRCSRNRRSLTSSRRVRGHERRRGWPPAALHHRPERSQVSAPRKVFLFSGHMIDAKDREQPRFPPDKEPVAARAIASARDDAGAGAADVGITEGACGGDLLFAEAMLERGARLELRLPFDEATFLRKSVE